MYEIIKNVIESGDYELKDYLHKINRMYMENEITEEQKNELDNLAREYANAENSYAPVQKQIDDIYVEINEIKDRINKLEGTEPVEPEEYPEYVQPSGSHDAYNTGDKITYNGKKYVCKMDGCVWSPETYPSAWEEVVESEVQK